MASDPIARVAGIASLICSAVSIAFTQRALELWQDLLQVEEAHALVHESRFEKTAELVVALVDVYGAANVAVHAVFNSGDLAPTLHVTGDRVVWPIPGVDAGWASLSHDTVGPGDCGVPVHRLRHALSGEVVWLFLYCVAPAREAA